MRNSDMSDTSRRSSVQDNAKLELSLLDKRFDQWYKESESVNKYTDKKAITEMQKCFTKKMECWKIKFSAKR